MVSEFSLDPYTMNLQVFIVECSYTVDPFLVFTMLRLCMGHLEASTESIFWLLWENSCQSYVQPIRHNYIISSFYMISDVVSHLILVFPIFLIEYTEYTACSYPSCSNILLSKKSLACELPWGELRRGEGRVHPAWNSTSAGNWAPGWWWWWVKRVARVLAYLRPGKWFCYSGVTKVHHQIIGCPVPVCDIDWQVFLIISVTIWRNLTLKELFSIAVLSAAVWKCSFCCFENKYPAS